MSDSENKQECDKNDEEEKAEEKEAPLQLGLKITTETSTVVFAKSQKNDCSNEDPIPKNFKDFDTLLKKILSNLEETENVFFNQVKAIVERDLILIDWRLRLKCLDKILKGKKREFERIDQTVQCILTMSSHIDNILVKLEKELHGSAVAANAFKYCPARMRIYDALMKINLNQRDSLQQITHAILSINEAIDGNPSDPVEQFTRVLSLHTDVLKTIETRSGLVNQKLKIVQALYRFYVNRRSQC